MIQQINMLPAYVHRTSNKILTISEFIDGLIRLCMSSLDRKCYVFKCSFIHIAKGTPTDQTLFTEIIGSLLQFYQLEASYVYLWSLQNVWLTFSRYWSSEEINKDMSTKYRSHLSSMVAWKYQRSASWCKHIAWYQPKQSPFLLQDLPIDTYEGSLAPFVLKMVVGVMLLEPHKSTYVSCKASERSFCKYDLKRH